MLNGWVAWSWVLVSSIVLRVKCRTHGPSHTAPLAAEFRRITPIWRMRLEINRAEAV